MNQQEIARLLQFIILTVIGCVQNVNTNNTNMNLNNMRKYPIHFHYSIIKGAFNFYLPLRHPLIEFFAQFIKVTLKIYLQIKMIHT